MTVSVDLNFPRACGEPPVQAVLKSQPADFYVEEQLDFIPAGSGEHQYLFIEKQDMNTQDVARLLARAAGIAPTDVGYSGMKDKRAVTRQWFSLHVPKQPSFVAPVIAGFSILRQHRHTQKLRRGSHGGNFFRIRLRNLRGDTNAIAARIGLICQGVPNYFGEQRFGYGGDNVRQVDALVARSRGKQQRHHDRLLVSAARAWVFNQVLAERVRRANWQSCIDGEPHAQPTGPLWGRGRLASRGALLEMETAVIQPFVAWCHFLEHTGLQQERRPLVLAPQQLDWQLADDTLLLEFSLPAGAYATVLLRELATLVTVDGPAVGDPAVP